MNTARRFLFANFMAFGTVTKAAFQVRFRM